EAIHNVTRYDPWFLEQIKDLIDEEEHVRKNGLPSSADDMRRLKKKGFSDARLATLAGLSEDQVAELRAELDIRPVFKRIDTCAAEFEARTPYMYSTYDYPADGQVECESAPSDREKVVILGGGPNRIGQGIEFDYCCCHACFALSDAGYETIMVNCNPETVSTDYDTSDRLYFEPLTGEDVLELLRVEMSKGTLKGVVVQLGGQTPLKLAGILEAAGIPILGTSPDAIDLAEDRERFQQLIGGLGLRQPRNGIAKSEEEAKQVAEYIGYPVLIRPSYVLGGRAMEIIDSPSELERYIGEAVKVSGQTPVLVDAYLRGAVEVDVDAICDGENVHIAGILEHIEEAGIHSGDSACALPPHNLPSAVIEDITHQTKALAKALNVIGLMNVQYAVKDDDVYLIEVNPRASRTVPFVAKAAGTPFAKIASRVMAGERLDSFDLPKSLPQHSAVKEAVFPFVRFPGVDVILGPEMRSTGEVMGLDSDFEKAFAKSQIAAGAHLPIEGRVFISVKDADKPAMVAPAKSLIEAGFEVVATDGTAEYLQSNDVQVTRINKVLQGRPHIVDAMENGEIDLVFNTTEGGQSIRDSYSIRQTTLMHKIPYYTTVAGSLAATEAIRVLQKNDMDVRPLQSYALGEE
ncbi:MAG: carbamoyl-phosphate synthase large subunit, partial [Sphingomonadales bacterium]